MNVMVVSWSPPPPGASRLFFGAPLERPAWPLRTLIFALQCASATTPTNSRQAARYASALLPRSVHAVNSLWYRRVRFRRFGRRLAGCLGLVQQFFQGFLARRVVASTRA